MDFPHDEFGYPLAADYGATVDLSLIRSDMTSLWQRQRRGYTHAASLVKVSFSLDLRKSGQLIDWLQDNDDWFNMELISGDSSAEAEPVYPVKVRRTSTVASSRVPLRDASVVSFEVETHSMPDHQALLAAATGQPAYVYPPTLPLPQAEGFASTHDDRNVTVYSLSYSMNTATLKQWQAFAAFAGTAWFKTFMVSANTYGADEVIRYTSSADMTLVAPDSWLVSISAEGYPNRGYLPEFASAPVTEGSYDYPIEYDTPDHTYDGSDGGVIPPQGSFTMPAGTVIVSQSVSGASPLSGTASLSVYRNGSIVCTPSGNPAWNSWHTDADTLVAPALTINATVEVSTDGTTWSTNVPGTRYDIKSQDVHMRLVYTASADDTRAVSVPMQFDDGTVTYALASATAQLSVTLDVTATGGVVQGFVWEDITEVFETDVGTAGIQVQSNGSCIASGNGATTGAWHAPLSTGVGNGKWVVINKLSGNSAINNEGIRLSLDAPRTYSIVARPPGTLPYEFHGTYYGNVSIYSAQVGGTLLGSGTITLDAAVFNGTPP